MTKRSSLLILPLLLIACAKNINEPIDTSSSAASQSSSVASLSPGIDETGLGLTIPDGFRIETFAEGISGARVIVQDGFGNFWISRPSLGMVTHLEMSGSTVRNQSDIFRGLNKPHGLAIDPVSGFTLYIAEEDAIKRAVLYSDAPLETVSDLPLGGRHTTRTIGFGPDDRLYVSVGSTCDVCIEANNLTSTIFSIDRDGSDRKIVATGLRNAVFFTWSLVDGSMWATEMGRDNLGDNLPPDEVNVITQGSHYGWPFCYGNNIRDESFEPSTSFDCNTTIPPKLEIPAHSAPLGLAFIPEEGWSEEYWYDLLVALHGSMSRSEPAGYTIVRFPLDAHGNPEGPMEDFISGWRDGALTQGRPVDIIAQPGGVLYITDDKGGRVYRMTVSQ
jgi:glucose/arabinose dehydrogenase